MTNNKPTPVGAGRASISLGAKDPRTTHRNVQAAQDSEKRYGVGLAMNNQGKLGIRQVRRVEILPMSGTDLPTLIAAFNNLVEEFRKAGHIA